MQRILIFSCLVALTQLAQIARAEVVDESWRQVYEFQNKMAAAGNSKAQFTLGEMYEHGRGVKQDFETAIDWYNKAKRNGHAEAAERIAMLQKTMKNEEKQKQEAQSREQAEKELEKQQREEEKAAQREREEQQKRTASKKKTSKPKKVAKKKQAKVAKLTTEQRMAKIKEAQERANEIAKKNKLKQQKEAEAALKKYKKEMEKEIAQAKAEEEAKAKAKAKAEMAKAKKSDKIPEKYLDPFE